MTGTELAPVDPTANQAMVDELRRKLDELQRKTQELIDKRIAFAAWVAREITLLPLLPARLAMYAVRMFLDVVDKAIQKAGELLEAAKVPLAMYEDVKRWLEIERLVNQELVPGIHPQQADHRNIYAGSPAADFEWHGRVAQSYRLNVPPQLEATRYVGALAFRTSLSVNAVFAAAIAVYSAWLSVVFTLVVALVRLMSGAILDGVGEMIGMVRLLITAYAMEEAARRIGEIQAIAMQNTVQDNSVILPAYNGWPDPTRHPQFMHVAFDAGGRPYLEGGAVRIQRFNQSP